MMANASKDPLWQAVVESEVAGAPDLKVLVEDKCATCHAPMGRTQAIHEGKPAYSLEEIRSSSLALDGVSCTLCHQIQSENLGKADSFSGNYLIDESRTIFGPYRDGFFQPMRNNVNYSAVFGEQVTQSELCATCHTLYTPVLDDTGQIIGKFPEQTPYLEWKNSVYPGEGVECQDCHMPRVDEPVKISNRPPFVSGQTPFFKHVFVGGNTFTLQILKEHAASLGVTATAEQLEAKISQTRNQIRSKAVRLYAQASIQEKQLLVDLILENLTGHKFPTGFPSRRAWLHVTVRTEEGEILFESGAHDSSGRIVGLSSTVEPHHELIEDERQVQIYEPVMEDSNGQPTFTLLRAARYKKDNRLPPRGFISTAPDSGDVAIAGEASRDANFNRDGVVEGTGRDSIQYLVNVAGREGRLLVEVELLFQTVPPRFVDHLRERKTPATEQFGTLYDSANKNPEVLQSIELDVTLSPAGNTFRRGDVNSDGWYDVSDAVFIIFYLLAGGEHPSCMKSADIDASGVVDLSDTSFLLRHLFLDGQAPPPPFPNCGIDNSDSDLTCLSYPSCQ